MDARTRSRLVERRAMLGLRRRRVEVSASYRRVAPMLCAAGVHYAKLMPVHIGRVLGTRASGPGQDEELDFGWIPGAETSRWSSPAQRDALCRWALAAVAEEGEDVAVIWHPARAGIRLRVEDLRSHLAPILDEGNGDTTWLVSASGGSWLVQIGFWSATVAYARHVPDPPGNGR